MPGRAAAPHTLASCLPILGLVAALVVPGCASKDSSPTPEASGETAPDAGASGISAGDAAWSAVTAGSPPFNVILITMDTTRRDRLSCYGFSEETTPNLDQIARDGVLFERAFTPVPVTLPAHATMLTGLYPYQHGVRHNGTYVLPDSTTTLAEMLEAKGYDTGAVLGAFPVDHRFGLAQGFDQYDDRFSRMGVREGDTAQRPATEVTRRALEWVDQHSERPFFLWTHYFDPHAPYHPPEPFAARFPGDAYAGEVAAMDAGIGTLVDGLAAKGLLERTILVVAGDHGEGLGDHQEPTHSMFIYGATQSVPFLLRLPDAGPYTAGKWRQQRVTAPVDLIDILPTIWNAVGMPASELPALAGKSLLPLVEGTGTGHDWVYMETLVPDLDYGMSELRGLLTWPWKYIRAPRPELFNLDEDPGELRNLAENEGDRLERMESQLRQILQEERTGTPITAMDQETLEKLRSLGYLQGATADAVVERSDPKDLTGVGRATAVAQSLAEGNRLPRAVALLDSLLSARPGTRLALRLRADYLTRLGKGPEALEAYDQALADCQGCPDEFRLRQEQVRAYLVAGQPAEALRRVQLLLQARPEEQGLNLQLAEILEEQGDVPGATEAYEREAALFPDDPFPLIKLGNLHGSHGQVQKAEKDYRQALTLDPQNPDALVMLAELLDKNGRRAEAETLVDRVFANNPMHSGAHYRKAWILKESGRKDAALSHYQLALVSSPNNSQILYELGSLYTELGRNPEAVENFQAAIEAGNAPPGVYSNLGVIAAQGGRLTEAVDYWQQALALKPPAQEAAIIQGNLQRAQELLRTSGGNTP